MINEIKLFLLVLSLIFTLRFVFQFTIKLFQENPEELTVNKIEKVLIHFAIAYIITYILI
jgi:nucleoside recognition membrane protein YjiH